MKIENENNGTQEHSLKPPTLQTTNLPRSTQQPPLNTAPVSITPVSCLNPVSVKTTMMILIILLPFFLQSLNLLLNSLFLYRYVRVRQPGDSVLAIVLVIQMEFNISTMLIFCCVIINEATVQLQSFLVSISKIHFISPVTVIFS